MTCAYCQEPYPVSDGYSAILFCRMCLSRNVRREQDKLAAIQVAWREWQDAAEGALTEDTMDAVRAATEAERRFHDLMDRP